MLHNYKKLFIALRNINRFTKFPHKKLVVKRDVLLN